MTKFCIRSFQKRTKQYCHAVMGCSKCQRRPQVAPEVSKPIAYLINLKISTSTIPSAWKTANVTPIYKSGDPNSYQQISVHPLISKVMERAVQSQLVAFIIKHNLLWIHQSKFRKKHSTETAAVYFVNHEQTDDDWVYPY